MHSNTKQQLQNILSGKTFTLGVDLGCGSGDAGPILKQHIDYLIGVDSNRLLLTQAHIYDELILQDIRMYVLPKNTEAVFLFDVIEHIPHNDGEQLLLALMGVRNAYLTTPKHFFLDGAGGVGPHQSLWTEEELKNYGFTTFVYQAEILAFLGHTSIFACREE